MTEKQETKIALVDDEAAKAQAFMALFDTCDKIIQNVMFERAKYQVEFNAFVRKVLEDNRNDSINEPWRIWYEQGVWFLLKI